MCTKSGVDSSSRFSFRAQTNRQTQLNVLPTPTAIQPAWVIKTFPRILCLYAVKKAFCQLKKLFQCLLFLLFHIQTNKQANKQTKVMTTIDDLAWIYASERNICETSSIKWFTLLITTNKLTRNVTTKFPTTIVTFTNFERQIVLSLTGRNSSSRQKNKQYFRLWRLVQWQ